MKQKILVIILALLTFQLPALAQSMSDSQLIQYVQKEMEKGTPQQTIIQNLIKRGVTTEQLQRVRRKVEAEQKQLGAKDLTSNAQESRLRTGRSTQTAQDKGQRDKQTLGALPTQMTPYQERRLTTRERQQLIASEGGFLGLEEEEEYDEQLWTIPREQQVYGRNIFNQKGLSFEPNQNMATPANYRLGAGDHVIIDVWGASQETFYCEVSPDGTVTIQGVGPIQVGGLSVSDATSRLRSHLGRYYSDCEVSLSLGETRSIIVQVMGEVQTPGTYTLSGLSSAFNALYAAGGISDVGTLRDIKVYRSGRCIAHIDVYDYLENGNAAGDVRLQDNDVIIVGPYDCLVAVSGKVKRPMFYEMKSSESVKQVLQFAGGFAGDAYTKNVRLIRKSGDEHSIHTIDEFSMAGFTLADGDSIYVDSVIPRFRNMVEVRGAVMHPGQFQMDGRIQSVRDLLQVAEGLREDAFTERAVMHREKDDLTLEMISLDIQGIMDGRLPDIALKKNDVLFIPSKTEMRGEETLRINGEVNYPGTYQFAENTTIQDLILQAGGLTRSASTAKIDVFRRNYDPAAQASGKNLARVFSFNLANGFVVEDTIFALLPYDEVQVRKSPVYADQQNVRISGAVNFEGEFAMTSKEFRLSDLVSLAGGLSEVAYAKGARLIRQMTEEEREQRDISLEQSQISLLEQGLDAENNFNRELADSLLDLKMNQGYEYPVAVKLDEAMQHPGGVADIVLRANDRLVVPQFSNTIQVAGEVMYPISITYQKGKSLGYYINRAGGYTQKASKGQTYAIYMNGSVDKLGRHARSGKLEPGAQIVVPTKSKRKGMSTAEISVLGTSAASLTTMIVALINLLK